MSIRYKYIILTNTRLSNPLIQLILVLQLHDEHLKWTNHVDKIVAKRNA